MNVKLYQKAAFESTLFRGLSKQEATALLESAVAKHTEQTTEIFRQDTPPPGMFLVVKGNVSIFVINEAGHQANLIRAGQGDVLCDLEAVTQNPCLATGQTEPGCCLLMWPADKVPQLLNTPRIAQNLITLSYERLAIVNQVRTIEHYSNVDNKIHACLLRMSETNPLINHSQAYIAEAVGCSRQTVNRVLGTLRDQETVALRKSKIEVINRPLLKGQLTK